MDGPLAENREISPETNKKIPSLGEISILSHSQKGMVYRKPVKSSDDLLISFSYILGPSINYVVSKLKFFDPLPTCRLFN